MKRFKRVRAAGVLVPVVATLAFLAAQAQDQRSQPPYGPGMMGQGRGGMMGPGMGGGMGRGPMMGPQGAQTGGTMNRRHQAMMEGLPEPYAGMTNPLPRTRQTMAEGAQIYADNCASCHGPRGLGDGEAGGALSPRPTNLAALSRMPPGQWDAYLYWSTAEGGAPVGSAMPGFKDVLSDEQIWAVVSYIEDGLPDTAASQNYSPQK